LLLFVFVIEVYVALFCQLFTKMMMFSNIMGHMCTTKWNMFLNYDVYQCWGHVFTTTCN